MTIIEKLAEKYGKLPDKKIEYSLYGWLDSIQAPYDQKGLLDILNHFDEYFEDE